MTYTPLMSPAHGPSIPKRKRLRFVIAMLLPVLLLVGWGGRVARAQKPFSELVGPVRVAPVKDASPLRVPYLTWGGDVATFLANGGLKTTSESLYGKQGLDLQLTPGDDFVGQVRDYLGGKTPFLRGTYRMLSQASEVVGKDPRTKPVVVLQLSWSAGDHLIARESIRTLNDLRGKGKKVRIACQQGGPHVGLLYDSLTAAQIARDEVEIVWVDDLTGPQGAAERFREDPSVDVCCVITPDMIGLTGGFESVGSGAEGTIKGSHVLNSTQTMSRSIADVVAVRSDWFKTNRPIVEKFVAGYLKATEQLVQMRKEFESSGKLTASYRKLLQMSQSIFGEEVLPTLEVDAHGLLLDCSFVGLPGQIAFFESEGNPSGFAPMMKRALDLAVDWGYSKGRFGFESGRFDYRQLAKLAGVPYAEPNLGASRIDAEGVDLFPDSALDDRTIVSFTIGFAPNQSTFSADQYGSEFNRAIQQASQFGNAVVAIRGHSDPTKTLVEMIQAGTEKGIIARQGKRGSYRYFINGRPFDLKATEELTALIQKGAFEGTKHRPRETMQAALNLSLARANAVKKSLVQFSEQQNVVLDVSQMQPVGAGISEPVIPKPRNIEEAKENMRVEFRIVRIPAEALKDSDFDF